jgi:branched-chain amino acid aminotransferase
MRPLVFLKDRFLSPSEDARVSLFDRGYLLGDAIFETLRAYDGAAFAVDAHLDRLEHAAEGTGIRPPHDRASLAALIAEAIHRSGLASAYVRITVSRGEVGSYGLGTLAADAPVLSIVVRDLGGYPDHAYEDGIDTQIVRARKVPAACIDPTMKTGSYMPNVLARREIDGAGMLEGVQLSVDGLVVSGTVSNLFLVAAGQLRTPDEASGCRLGVTRAVLLDLARALGIPTQVGPITVEDLGQADEAFFANTLMECLPIRRIAPHARPLASAAPSSMTKRLLTAYRENVRKLAST